MRTLPSLLAVAFVSLAVPAGADNTLGPKRPSDIVSLTTAGGSLCDANTYALERQILPDATVVPFTIPDGHVLVLTGIDWIVFAPPNTYGFATITLYPDPNTRVAVFSSGSSVTGVNNLSAGSALIPNIIVKPGPMLCVGVPGIGSSARVQGFLTRDK
jgi:hypothetical protein